MFYIVLILIILSVLLPLSSIICAICILLIIPYIKNKKNTSKHTVFKKKPILNIFSIFRDNFMINPKYIPTLKKQDISQDVSSDVVSITFSDKESQKSTVALKTNQKPMHKLKIIVHAAKLSHKNIHIILANYNPYHRLRNVEEQDHENRISILVHYDLDNFEENEKRSPKPMLKKYSVQLYLCGGPYKPWKGTTNHPLEIAMDYLTQGKNMNTVFIGELLNNKFSIEVRERDTDEGERKESTQFNKELQIWLLINSDIRESFAKIIIKERLAESSAYFIGGKITIENIERTFREESNIAVLYGIGGIGKSQICRKLFDDYSVRSGTNLVKNLGWINYESLENSLFGQFPDIESSCNDIQKYCEMAYSYLQEQGNELLLFLDNANTILSKEVTELSRLGCKILLTSRKKLDRIFSIETDQLPIEDCKKLYRTYSQDSESPDEVIEQIIELAAKHTLSIELLAKTQCSTMITAQELLQELKKSGFNLTEIMEEFADQRNLKQATTDETEKRFIEHMSKIFDLSEIKSLPEELRILQQFSPLAPNVPISIKKIKSWLELENLNDLNKIIQKGWLNYQIQDRTPNITIHHLIASVVQHMALPDAEVADALIGHVADDLRLKPTEIFIEKLDIFLHAESIIKSLDIDTVNYANLLHNAAYICDKQSEYSKALEWYQKALNIFMNQLGEQHPYTNDVLKTIKFLKDNYFPNTEE